jgi:hypothetical protein
MQRYRTILTLMQAAVAGLFGIAVGQHEYFVSLFGKEHATYFFGGALLALFFLFRQCNALTELLIAGIPGLSPALRKTIMGRRFVEGDWPLVVLDEEKRAIKYLGFLTVTYSNGELKVRGTDWHPDGRHAHDFSSQQSLYSKNALQYWYYQGERGHMRGYTEIYFLPQDRAADRLVGEFLDKHHKSSRFYARRRAYKWSERRLRSEAEKIAAAQEVWAWLEPKLARIRGREIADYWE